MKLPGRVVLLENLALSGVAVPLLFLRRRSRICATSPVSQAVVLIRPSATIRTSLTSIPWIYVDFLGRQQAKLEKISALRPLCMDVALKDRYSRRALLGTTKITQQPLETSSDNEKCTALRYVACIKCYLIAPRVNRTKRPVMHSFSELRSRPPSRLDQSKVEPPRFWLKTQSIIILDNTVKRTPFPTMSKL